MYELYARILSLCNKKGIKGGKMCVDLGISKSLMTDLKMGRKKSVNAETAQKIASYFHVSVGYLLGEEIEKAPTTNGERSVCDDDIKFALFGGDGDITDEMYEEVKDFAEYIKKRGPKKK